MIGYKILKQMDIPLQEGKSKTYLVDAPEEHNIIYTVYQDAERRANELSERDIDDFVVYEFEVE